MHLRAMMLVGMCQSEMLPRGKASNIARDVITEHLKKPDFNTELVAQVDEAEKDNDRKVPITIETRRNIEL